jgi:hypothetical protein
MASPAQKPVRFGGPSGLSNPVIFGNLQAFNTDGRRSRRLR